jgi:uncharacterized protein (DUF433 family)
MQLEDYFEFEKLATKFGEVQHIRLRGHRIGIEHIIESFNEGLSAARIRQQFPTLSLEQVYATITYYLHNQAALDEYVREGIKIAEAYYEEWLAHPSPLVERLRAVKDQQRPTEQAGA